MALATQNDFRHVIAQVGVSQSAAPAMQNDMTTCLEMFENEDCEKHMVVTTPEKKLDSKYINWLSDGRSPNKWKPFEAFLQDIRLQRTSMLFRWLGKKFCVQTNPSQQTPPSPVSPSMSLDWHLKSFSDFFSVIRGPPPTSCSSLIRRSNHNLSSPSTW
jgi:hypothetical protein